MIILEGAGALEPRTVSLTHAAVLCVAPGYCSPELSFPRKLPSSVASSPPARIANLYSFILRIKLYDLKTEVNQNKVKLKIK